MRQRPRLAGGIDMRQQAYDARYIAVPTALAGGVRDAVVATRSPRTALNWLRRGAGGSVADVSRNPVRPFARDSRPKGKPSDIP